MVPATVVAAMALADRPMNSRRLVDLFEEEFMTLSFFTIQPGRQIKVNYETVPKLVTRKSTLTFEIYHNRTAARIQSGTSYFTSRSSFARRHAELAALRQNFTQYLSVNVGQTALDSIVIKTQSFVVNSEEM